uniref:Cytoplasmic envelopment protein 3 n=4 Tax=Roseolovirus TaxID=40272 RepID=A0A140AK98_9BETA|nr:myristylated tegument protein [Human betaherpesvirus 6A]APO39049.1 myristylated tegument protein [Human betaherpesvirus 6A]APO39209.1 myristylated tegument protein [Human betaherpesvirus 6A]QCO43470.1 U71 [Human betaherpesvirus 6A]QOI15252.1 myristylated tegument protein [Human betaherpesvirus 6A]
MGAKCCKPVSCGMCKKTENTLIDYKGNPILLENEFTVLTDTESEEEGMADLEKPLLEKVQTTLVAKCDTEAEKKLPCKSKK